LEIVSLAVLAVACSSGASNLSDFDQSQLVWEVKKEGLVGVLAEVSVDLNFSVWVVVEAQELWTGMYLEVEVQVLPAEAGSAASVALVASVLAC
jgi:hypothetical protein